jgi:hypothetical protein
MCSASIRIAIKRNKAAKPWVASEFIHKRDCHASIWAGVSKSLGMKKLVWPAVARYRVYEVYEVVRFEFERDV